MELQPKGLHIHPKKSIKNKAGAHPANDKGTMWTLVPDSPCRAIIRNIKY